jgi:hypothetical protein
LTLRIYFRLISVSRVRPRARGDRHGLLRSAGTAKAYGFRRSKVDSDVLDRFLSRLVGKAGIARYTVRRLYGPLSKNQFRRLIPLFRVDGHI